MNDTRHLPVFGREGPLGWVEGRADSGADSDVLVRLENGTLIQVPGDIIIQQNDGSYFLPISKEQFTEAQSQPSGSQRQTLMVIPVMVEEAQVRKQRTTRRVRIHKSVNQREETVDEPGYQEQVNIERVPVDKVVETAPQPRYEGKTFIIPVLEEVLVIEKRLVLKEEVRVTKRRTPTHSPQTVTLRAEDIQVEHLEAEDNNALQDTQPAERRVRFPKGENK